jgi:hypothetical protein
LLEQMGMSYRLQPHYSLPSGRSEIIKASDFKQAQLTPASKFEAPNVRTGFIMAIFKRVSSRCALSQVSMRSWQQPLPVFFFFFNVFLGDRDGSVRALSTTCVSVFHGNFYLRSTVKIAFLSSQALG